MTRILSSLESGRKARIVKISLAGDIRRRLSDMGLVNGSEVQLMRVAPLGDPLEIRIKGYDLSLRKEVASQIEVDTLDTQLVNVEAGRTVSISSTSGGKELVRRLADMGITPGVQIMVIENHHPGPVLVNVRGSRLMLGQGMAEKILVLES
jgi:ferrous iron transport protein A